MKMLYICKQNKETSKLGVSHTHTFTAIIFTLQRSVKREVAYSTLSKGT